MEDSPIYRLPEDALHQIFSSLSLRQIMISRSVCKLFNQILTSSSFMHLISTRSHLNLLALRPPHHHRHNHGHHHVSLFTSLHVYDPDQNHWLRFNLDFLPFRSPHPVASSLGLVYLWADSPDSLDSNKSLIVCNPLTRQYRVLPQLGSAWSRHGSVLVDSRSRVMVLTELAALYFSFSQKTQQWLKFSSNLPSKPRSPIVVSNSIVALCDVGSPWRCTHGEFFFWIFYHFFSSLSQTHTLSHRHTTLPFSSHFSLIFLTHLCHRLSFICLHLLLFPLLLALSLNLSF